MPASGLGGGQNGRERPICRERERERSVECGVWSVKCGVWSVKCGVWSVECGRCGSGLRLLLLGGGVWLWVSASSSGVNYKLKIKNYDLFSFCGLFLE